MKKFRLKAGRKEGINKQQWLDWLSDEPPTSAAQAELRQKRLEQARRAQYQGPRVAAPSPQNQPVATQPPQRPQPTPAAPPASGVSIQINIPQFQRPQFTRVRRAYRYVLTQFKRLTHKQLIIIGAVAAVIIVSWIGAAITQHAVKHRTAAQQSGTASQSAAGGATGDVASSKPDFTPVVPSGKSSLATPDNTHARYDATKQSYSFFDSIDGKQVTVSQQRMASSTEAAQDALQAAKNLQNANTTGHKIQTGWGEATVLINQKYNTLMVVFSVQDKLVFLQSTNIIGDNVLVKYVNSLD